MKCSWTFRKLGVIVGWSVGRWIDGSASRIKGKWKFPSGEVFNKEVIRVSLLIPVDWAGFLKVSYRNFSGPPVVKDLPCNAGDGDLTPGLGTKISHTVGNWAHLMQKRSQYAATRESLSVQWRRPRAALPPLPKRVGYNKKEWNNTICSNMDGIEMIILSEVSQKKKDKCHMILLICGI